MSSLLESIRSKNPRFLAAYGCEDAPHPSLERWNSGPEFVTKRLSCTCGCQRFLIETNQRISRSGFLFKTITAIHAPPFHTVCDRCKKRQLLFDDAIHGWNGAENDSSKASEAPTLPYSREPGGVLVNYSYQGLENYEDLRESGLPNLEDCFDTFTLYLVPESGPAIQVSTVECA